MASSRCSASLAPTRDRHDAVVILVRILDGIGMLLTIFVTMEVHRTAHRDIQQPHQLSGFALRPAPATNVSISIHRC
jgi:hypothetical protein